jgi:hypothetical protein
MIESPRSHYDVHPLETARALKPIPTVDPNSSAQGMPLRKPKVLNEVQLIKLLVGIFIFHGEKGKENLPFNLAVDTSTLLTN